MPTTDQQQELTRSLHRSHGSYELALAPVLMALIGLWLDKTFDTLPIFTIVLAVVVGGTPLGAPLIGWVAVTFGPRWSMAAGAASGIIAALIGAYYLVKHRSLRVHREAWRVRYTVGPPRASVSTDGQEGAVAA
jgi:MFS family permease